MLGNQMDESTLVLKILSGLPAERDVIKTVLETMDVKGDPADVRAKLLTVGQLGSHGRSSSAAGIKSQAFAEAASETKWDNRALVLILRQEAAHDARRSQEARRRRQWQQNAKWRSS